MTKKYFYDDPLAAAWMAKHFRMKLQINDFTPGKEGAIDLDHLTLNSILKIDGFPAAIILIHPDSLAILEPQVGDYIYLPDVLGFNVIDEVAAIHENGNISTVSYKRPYESGKQIIQRNSLAFHWPKSE